ncbi:MAG: CoA-binding protein [Chloroflexota bacterium]|jgi:predicted CoA-binding protein
MTPEERARTIAYLDLAEGRGSVPMLDDDGVRQLLATARRIAVIGASDRPGRASGDVFRHLLSVGYDCVPVNPRASAVAGVPAYATLAEAAAATGSFDIVDVFRRAELCAAHAKEAVDAGARCLWLQLGIVDWEAARIAHDAGLAVVMDRCLSVEWRRLGRRPVEEA